MRSAASDSRNGFDAVLGAGRGAHARTLHGAVRDWQRAYAVFRDGWDRPAEVPADAFLLACERAVLALRAVLDRIDATGATPLVRWRVNDRFGGDHYHEASFAGVHVGALWPPRRIGGGSPSVWELAWDDLLSFDQESELDSLDVLDACTDPGRLADARAASAPLLIARLRRRAADGVRGMLGEQDVAELRA